MSEKLTIGQTIVYPAYGVVNIQGIEEKEICDSKKSFYILKIIENNATLMVPTDNASSLGLRPIISRKEVPNILKILGKKTKSSHSSSGGKSGQSWNRRYKEYDEKLKSGDIVGIAEVLQEIHYLSKNKSLSFGEKKLMDSALNLLVKELAVATEKEEETITDKIEKLLS